MLTDLEKYLNDKRCHLDVESPDDTVIWEGIRTDLLHSQGRRMGSPGRIILRKVRNAAAIAIILLSLGYIANDLFRDYRFSRTVNLTAIDIDLGKREQEYKTLVDYKQKEIRSIQVPENSIIKELFEEIKNLDKVYSQALKDLGELGNNEQVINTIFDIYEKKIHLLELVILETNKIRNNEANDEIIM
ncbi:MAG TPA: hypothetical protein VMW76_09590 [Bacteroidales bacterium]|nr:hypothetical protein [Bacteroidales bacterium]